MKKLTISIEMEIEEGHGTQEIGTAVVDRAEEAIRASMPDWAALADMKMKIEHGQTLFSVAPVTVKTAHVQDIHSREWKEKALQRLMDTQGLRIKRATA